MSIPISRVNQFRHKINPMHVYCRLIDAGVSSNGAKDIAQKYEVSFFKKFDSIVLMPTQRLEHYLKRNGNGNDEDYLW